LSLYLPIPHQEIRIKVKFKDSTFEERYNEYWNNSVVTVDQTIRNASLGFKLFDNTDISKLITTYQQYVINIFSNLKRRNHSPQSATSCPIAVM
jgi:hypothetical protein